MYLGLHLTSFFWMIWLLILLFDFRILHIHSMKQFIDLVTVLVYNFFFLEHAGELHIVVLIDRKKGPNTSQFYGLSQFFLTFSPFYHLLRKSGTGCKYRQFHCLSSFSPLAVDLNSKSFLPSFSCTLHCVIHCFI